MNTQDFFTSPKFGRTVAALGAILVILIIFQAGVLIGYERGTHALNWETDMGRGMGDPRSMLAPFMHDTDDPSSHGAIGTVVSVHQPLFMVKGASQAERVVVIVPSTLIRRMHTMASTSDILPGTQVVVIGAPGVDGRLQADFIRILPAPPGISTSTGSNPVPVRPLTPPNY